VRFCARALSLESRLQAAHFGRSVRPRDRLKATANDARYPGKVSVWYVFHPLYRTPDLSVVRKFGCHDVEYVQFAAPERQAVPAWMLDEERCAQMTIGLQPTVDLAALLRLADWLQAQDL
jgi:hypothetical protein